RIEVGVFAVFAVELAVLLEQERREFIDRKRRVVRCMRVEEVHPVLLQNRNKIHYFLPRIRNLILRDAKLLHNIFAIEQHVEVLIFRKRVAAAVILIRNERAWPEAGGYLVVIVVLLQIDKSV